MVYIIELFVLQTIYVLNKEILQFLGLKSAVYNRERVIRAHVRYLPEFLKNSDNISSEDKDFSCRKKHMTAIFTRISEEFR